MSNRTRNLHAWKSKDADGRKREVRAQLFGSRWSLSSRFVDEEEWAGIERPSLEDLSALEEILFNKYQRRHVAWEHLLGVRKLIEALSPKD